MSLQDDIKKEIGYKEDKECCEVCKHHTEDENQYVDRMWDDHCHVAGLITISVKPDARCDKFEHA